MTEYKIEIDGGKKLYISMRLFTVKDVDLFIEIFNKVFEQLKAELVELEE